MLSERSGSHGINTPWIFIWMFAWCYLLGSKGQSTRSQRVDAEKASIGYRRKQFHKLTQIKTKSF